MFPLIKDELPRYSVKTPWRQISWWCLNKPTEHAIFYLQSSSLEDELRTWPEKKRQIFRTNKPQTPEYEAVVWIVWIGHKPRVNNPERIESSRLIRLKLWTALVRQAPLEHEPVLYPLGHMVIQPGSGWTSSMSARAQEAQEAQELGHSTWESWDAKGQSWTGHRDLNHSWFSSEISLSRPSTVIHRFQCKRRESLFLTFQTLEVRLGCIRPWQLKMSKQVEASGSKCLHHHGDVFGDV
jgi:hypothetical protein